MKLQEKHLEAIENNIPIEGSLYSDAEKAAEASTQITKDYMKRFAEWKDKNYALFSDFLPTFRYVDRFESSKNPFRNWNADEIKTIGELVEIFLETEK